MCVLVYLLGIRTYGTVWFADSPLVLTRSAPKYDFRANTFQFWTSAHRIQDNNLGFDRYDCAEDDYFSYFSKSKGMRDANARSYISPPYNPDYDSDYMFDY